MAQSITGTVRSILADDLSLTADQVIELAKRRGLTAPAARIREAVHNVRSALKKQGAVPAPSAARTTAPPEPAPAAPAPASPAPDLAGVLANVALVDRVAGASGGAANARQVAEAVRACGGVDAFLQHLDLVAAIKGG